MKDHPKGCSRSICLSAEAIEAIPGYNGFDQPNLVAPSKIFSSHVAAWDSATYQLSVRPDIKLGVEDIVLMHRDYYQGTRFDKSKSSLAGLYGSQYLYIAEMGECSILSVKTTHIHISQVSEALSSPVLWM